MGQIHACITNLMEIVSCKEGFLLDTFPNYHLPVSPQTSISPDSRSQSLPAIIPSFCRGAFIYSVIITLDQIIPARHLHSFISDWLVIYMRHWICCWRPNSLFFCQTFVNHSKKIISLWQKKMPPKLQVFNFLFTSPSYNFLNNSPPHHLLNFLRLFLTTSGNVYSDFPPKTQPWITEGQDTMGLEGTAHIRQLDFIHDFRIQQPFSICRSLSPPTQLLNYRYHHFAAFTFVYSHLNLADQFTLTSMKSNMAQLPAALEQALSMQDPVQLPVSCKLKLLLLFTSISGPHIAQR